MEVHGLMAACRVDIFSEESATVETYLSSRGLNDYPYDGPIFLVLLQCHIPQICFKMILIVT